MSTRDRERIQELNREVKELINKYKTFYMTDDERVELKQLIDSKKNDIACIETFRS